jgi:hypothetical protein
LNLRFEKRQIEMKETPSRKTKKERRMSDDIRHLDGRIAQSRSAVAWMDVPAMNEERQTNDKNTFFQEDSS